MTVVDFKNAKIEIVTSYPKSPVSAIYANLNTQLLRNSSGTTISNGNRSDVSLTPNKFVYNYNGTFTADGTEFYIYSTTPTPAKWKISNISFHSGDTYSFYIPITITCI